MNRRKTKTAWIGASFTIVLMICGAALSGRTTKLDVQRHGHISSYQNSVTVAPHAEEHRVPQIEGATNPSAIADDVARALFLRMAAHPDPKASEAYLRSMLNNVAASQANKRSN